MATDKQGKDKNMITPQDLQTALQHAAKALRQGASPASVARDLERLASDTAAGANKTKREA